MTPLLCEKGELSQPVVQGTYKNVFLQAILNPKHPYLAVFLYIRITPARNQKLLPGHTWTYAVPASARPLILEKGKKFYG